MQARSRRTLLQAMGAFGLAAALPRAHAQSAYPARPVHLVVPYPPGALTDILARAIGDRLSSALKQPVVVENKPGAGTLVGAEYVAKAAPDGYTLLMATSTTLGISPALYHPSPIDPVRDFAPVAQVGSVNFFLIANPAFPARNVRELIDVIKANPGKYNYASVGSGSPHHLFMETLKTQYGLQIQHVPYKGTPAALTDLLTDNVQVMFCDATVALPNVEAGKVIALGTSAARPTQLVSGVPPIAATVPGFDWQAWQGIVAPAATPKDVVARLAADMAKIQATSEFRAQLVRFGMEPFAPQSPAEFAAVIQSEQPRWQKAVRESGAKVD
ncbi:MAG TPA: tripartite tricarboxylate transporter substrate binding protein [Casimicrobiaceae bacterium]|jgi:tripartite-type tricarboxylate transporter receptor subunit TctC